MQSLNKNGVSITQTLGEEKFVKFRSGTFRGRTFYQYDYRHTEYGIVQHGSPNAERVPPQA